MGGPGLHWQRWPWRPRRCGRGRAAGLVALAFQRWWDDEAEAYDGVIDTFEHGRGWHVAYDDGDEEYYDDEGEEEEENADEFYAFESFLESEFCGGLWRWPPPTCSTRVSL